MKVYIDMDGVITKYIKSDYPSKFLSVPHYFKYRQLNIFEIPPHYIILSKVTTEEERRDKTLFIKKHFPNNKFILTKKPKHKRVNPQGNILIDDWNKNLNDWRDCGGIPIKYLNGINSLRKDILCIYNIGVLSALDSTINK